MTIKEAREERGLSRKEVCDWLKIPYRTLQSWEIGDRECPEWRKCLLLKRYCNMKTENKTLIRRVGSFLCKLI